MNAEELKQLKKGAEIFIRARYKKIDAVGDVLFLHSNTNVYGKEIETESYTHPGNVFLPPSAPKYDPCRPFKEGDEVRVLKERDGRKMPVCGAICPGEIYIVSDDEKDGDVMLRTCNRGHDCISWDWLELVTPAEELNPFSVQESEVVQGFDIVRDKLCVMSFPFGAKECGWYYNELAAKKAAEAECSRLNAAYRKAQNNGNQ